MNTFEELEQQKVEILALIASWPPSLLDFRPAENEWSAIEVLDHIVRAEAGIIALAQRGLSKPHAIGIRDRLGYAFLGKVFQTDRKVGVPRSAKMILPDRQATLPDVCARWDESRVQLAALLSDAAPEHDRMGIFRHPVSGWMTMPQLVHFFWLHVHHHRFQFERLKAASTKSLAAGG